MRLLYLSADPGIPILGHKGASVHVRALARAFQDLRHEVIVASPRVELAENPLPPGVRITEIPAVRPRECATATELVEHAERQAAAVEDLARRELVDGIYERYSLASFAGARTSASLRLPLVVEVNAPLREEEARFRVLRHEDVALTAEQETFAAARRIFAVSSSLATSLAASGVDPARVEVMENAAPCRRFPAKPPLMDNVDLVVGFAGGLKPWHGVEVLLAAFALALASGGRMRLEVAGTGPQERLLREASLPRERFRWLGQLPHERALDALEAWDVGVAPFTAVEGFYFSPLKLFEYMAAGLCPVVSGVGALPEIVELGRAGVVVPPDDPSALADALLALDRDRARVRELAARAQDGVRRRPSWTDNARRVIASLDGEQAA